MKLNAKSTAKFVVLLGVMTSFASPSLARESVWGLKFTQINQQFVILPNYMFENSYITVMGTCESGQLHDANVKVEFQWLLLQIDCMEELYKTETVSEKDMFNMLFQDAPIAQNVGNESSYEYDTWLKDLMENSTAQHVRFRFQFSKSQQLTCFHKQVLQLADESREPYFEASYIDEEVQEGYMKTKYHVTNMMTHKKKELTEVSNRVVNVWSDGMYHFFIRLLPVGNISYTANVVVEMRGQYGYLSAIEWPLLPVDGVMALVYLTAGSVWIIVWARLHEHSHKIHVVIGAVAVAGALGNTLCFIDLSVRNSDGIGVGAFMWIGKLVSTCQLSLTQLLLMIVSTGYGINRPILSRLYVRLMVAITVLSFITNAALIIVSSESLKIKYQHPWLFTTVLVIFSLVLLLVTGWIMLFSIHTFIYLFKRRHTSQSQLIIFCIYMGCCITVFATNVGVGIYTLSTGLLRDCLKDWKHEWAFTTVSHVQMFGLLIVLMWLWRPVDEYNRKVWRPLSTDEYVDEHSDDEEKEMITMDSI